MSRGLGFVVTGLSAEALGKADQGRNAPPTGPTKSAAAKTFRGYSYARRGDGQMPFGELRTNSMNSSASAVLNAPS
jgi:hypothetical protein